MSNNDSVKTLIQIRKSLARGKAGNLAENKAFLDFLTIQQELTAEFDKTWKTISEQMQKHDINKINGDWGHIIIAERTNYKATDIDVVPARFFKKTIDNSKIKAYMDLMNKAPKGISVSTTKYLTKKIKVA